MDLNIFLGIDPQGKNPEADLEGLSRIGDTVYAITSHGRNKDGKFRPNRHRLFALKVTPGAGDEPPSLE
ncbi:hypothetical protein, partial [Cereibacter sphaeroides]|uniref:hypothetical protein n=1 Tax=Cereibacter sphaeroides TaxID=1063 RepID=UPI001F466432